MTNGSARIFAEQAGYHHDVYQCSPQQGLRQEAAAHLSDAPQRAVVNLKQKLFVQRGRTFGRCRFHLSDGRIDQLFGAIAHDNIFLAKGHSYTTTALVGGDAELAAQFADGSFATLYLSPKDYHRIHMPCAGRLRRMIYVPGALFSVNPTTARGVPGLFAQRARGVRVRWRV